jgi:seryl-tRNA synthetase
LPTIILTLDDAVPAFLISDVQSKLAYLDQRLVAANLLEDGKTFEISPATPLDGEVIDELRARIQLMVVTMTEDAFEPELKVLDEHNGTMPFGEDPMPALVARREVLEEGTGFYALGPLLTSVVDYLDGRVRKIASELGARPYRFPALINPAYLEKVQYFKNFPHSLGFVTHLNENLPDIEQFAALACCENGQVQADGKLFSKPSAMLSPTICHHLYAALENSEIESPGVIATAEGNCFRFEARNMYSLERLWNFTMREIIFVGEEDFVSEGLEAVRIAMAAVLRDLDLTHQVITATDPFFVGTFRDQAAYQAAFELKYEIRAAVPFRKNTVAVGSINRHGNFFGRTLNIRTSSGTFADTGCFGLGFERMAFALVSQYGANPINWPGPIREAVAHLQPIPTAQQ